VSYSDLQALVDKLLHCGSHTLTYTTRYTAQMVYENFLICILNDRMMFVDEPKKLKKVLLAGSNSINELVPINNNILKV
jgi:hypothetical protein